MESYPFSWHNLTYENADPRTRDRFLMGNPAIVIGFCIFYFVLIKVILARYMDSRKAFETRLISLTLNTYLLCTAIYFFYKCCKIGWFTKYSWRCEPLDRSYSDEALEVKWLRNISWRECLNSLHPPSRLSTLFTHSWSLNWLTC